MTTGHRPVEPDRPIGVIDIGSNSIRLVVYDRLSRAPLPIINHKVVIGLGTEIERSGCFKPETVDQAVNAIATLVHVAMGVPVSRLALLATAAVRSAANRDALCDAVYACTGWPVSVLSGQAEARMSAFGVTSAFPDATGVMADLGGGSLEIVSLTNGEIRDQTSLDIGVLRLVEKAGDRFDIVRAIVADALQEVAWLREGVAGRFYAVGGTWRAFARVHFVKARHPLHVVHGYRMNQGEVSELTDIVMDRDRSSEIARGVITERRANILPWGAAILDECMTILTPQDVMFSAHGLREGFHFQLLNDEVRNEDALLSACRDLTAQHHCLIDRAATLSTWIRPAVGLIGEIDNRLVDAACILADAGWSEHPAHRATLTLSRILYMPWSVLDHGERAFLALATFVRYGGSAESEVAASCIEMLGDQRAGMSRSLGKILRLAVELCTRRDEMLATSSLVRVGNQLVLRISESANVVSFDRVERYAETAASALGTTITVERATTQKIAGTNRF